MIESSSMHAGSSNTQETLSADKREISMPENCLLKIKPTISPPPPTLSKAVAEDMKLKLLTRIGSSESGLEISNVAIMGMVYPLPMKNRQLTNDLNMQSHGENQTRASFHGCSVSKAA
ncbi:hypothetical protein OIU79_012965 [Salix purpurea]|uniref:Uncharacterized protein n=1 Tax=Salix purpurea TaxID=77065 RepID=A0A9Q0Q4Y4_SALPP|nr:hypothetical protein OIU79_012965 [Salix purpurea]